VKERGKRPASRFWTRLFKREQEKPRKSAAKTRRPTTSPDRASASAAATTTPEAGAPAQARPTPLERSLSEAKQMAAIGRKDPERLANMLSGILTKEREKARQEKERFEEQVWAILRRDEEQEAADGSSEEPAGPPRA
jgi:hypothetical protein